MSHRRVLRAISWGLLACLAIVGVGAVLYAAVPSGAPVTYTASDTVTMPAGTTINAQILNVLGALTAQAGLTAQGAMNLTGVLSPPQITASQDNYNPSGLATANYLNVTTSASWDLTGMVGSAGKTLLLTNSGNFNLTLRSESTGSTAANRFSMPADLTLPSKAMVLLLYDGVALRWRTISPALTGVTLSASYVDYQVQGADLAPPNGGFLRSYAKSTGTFTRDSAGNIVGPFGTGTGGGGGTSTDKLAKAATTGNITLSNPGTAVFDGITLSVGDRLLVWQQTTQNQNGIYLFQGSGASMVTSRTTDADDTADFVNNFSVLVQSGTLYGGVTFYLTNIGSVVLGTTNITFAVKSWGVKSETLNNKSTVAAAVTNGYIGADAQGNAAYNRIGSFAQHTALGTINAITVAARQMGIESTGGLVDLTSAIQMVAGGANQEVTLIGTHATNTVKLDNGNGLQLCGNTGSVIIGLNRAKVSFRFNTVLNVWEQTDCLGLEQVKNTYATIGNAVDEASGVTIGDVPSGTYCVLYGSTTKCYCASSACDNVVQLSTGKSFLIKNQAGSTIASLSEAGASTGFGTLTDRSVRVTSTASQTLPPGATDVPITFNDETCSSCFDTDNMHNSSTLNSHITFTTGGKYLVMCHGRFASGTDTVGGTTSLDANIRLNGTTTISGGQRFSPQSPAVLVNPSTIWNFTAGDYIEFTVSTSGSSGSIVFDQLSNRIPFCEAKQL